MTDKGDHRLVARLIGAAAVVAVLTAGLSSESKAQTTPLMKIKIDVSPSVGISQVEAGVQNLITGELAHLERSFNNQLAGAGEPPSLVSGFAISAYENIDVLVSVAFPGQTANKKDNANSLRITCGYLNDGTTYFRRATITDKSSIQFRLRNENLLKRSMKLDNPLFVAYVIFLVDWQGEEMRYRNATPAPTVTVEFL